MSDRDEMMTAVELVISRHIGRVNCKCSDDSYCPKWSLCVAGCGEWPCDAYDVAVIAKELLAAPVEPPVLSRVQKAIDYLTSDHDLDTRQEVVGKTLEILRSAPPELRAAALTKMIDSIWKPEDRSTYDNPSQKRGAEKLRDAILESLSQEGGK